jgi:hypothetical protein
MNGARDRRRPGPRPAAHLIALATAVALCVTGIAAVPALASGPTISVSTRTLLGAPGTPRYKPRTVRVSQAGHAYVITGIRWHGWNGASATGTGRVRFRGHRTRATLIASSRAYCSTIGAFLYDKLRVRL